MGLFDSLFDITASVTKATIKTVVSPIAVASDLVQGDLEFNDTSDLLESAQDDLEDAIEEIF